MQHKKQLPAEFLCTMPMSIPRHLSSLSLLNFEEQRWTPASLGLVTWALVQALAAVVSQDGQISLES